MKKFIAILLFSFMCIFAVNAQNFVAKQTVHTVQSLTKTATNTGKLYNGLPVWKSKNGKYFVVKQSKKTGNYYSYYLTAKL